MSSGDPYPVSWKDSLRPWIQGLGKAWFFQDKLGWAGGFSSGDLNFGRRAAIPATLSPGAIAYDSSTHTGFFTTNSFYDTGLAPLNGSVYRACLLEEMPSGIHEIVEWPLSGTPDVCGSYYDTTNSTLYVVSCSHNDVIKFTLGATDCAQSSSGHREFSLFANRVSLW